MINKPHTIHITADADTILRQIKHLLDQPFEAKCENDVFVFTQKPVNTTALPAPSVSASTPTPPPLVFGPEHFNKHGHSPKVLKELAAICNFLLDNPRPCAVSEIKSALPHISNSNISARVHCLRKQHQAITYETDGISHFYTLSPEFKALLTPPTLGPFTSKHFKQERGLTTSVLAEVANFIHNNNPISYEAILRQLGPTLSIPIVNRVLIKLLDYKYITCSGYIYRTTPDLKDKLSAHSV